MSAPHRWCLASLVIAALWACRGPLRQVVVPAREPPAARPIAAAPDVPAPPKPETERRASGPVNVRLSSLEPRDSLVIRGATREPLRVVRRGALVELDGADARETIEISTRTTPLEVEGRSYRGALRIRAGKSGPGLEVTNVVDLEDYLAGVVAREAVLWTSDLEALRAQAIASRSYAVAALDERGRRRADPYLFADTRDQVYEGLFVPKNARERALVEKLAVAIDSTRGEVLVEDGRVVDARFHAACGGATANAASVFPEADFACLRSVACPACDGSLGGAVEASSASPWSWTASRAQLDELARSWKLGSSLRRLRAVERDSAGRWLEVELEGDTSTTRASFEKLRRALGASHLASARVVGVWPREGELLTGGLRFDGRGRGHGVGLCQEGARACAAAGWSAERILRHFYPGAKLADLR